MDIYGSDYIISPARWAMPVVGLPMIAQHAYIAHRIHYCSDLGQNVNQSLIPQNKTHVSSSGYSERVPECLWLKQK